MLPELNEHEARVIGCLIEKSITTPDQYPLTLNALVNACNQKSSRQPVLSLTPGEVERAARDLADRHLLLNHDNDGNRVSKYSHRLCNTRYSHLQLNDAELAVICLLLLRGPQTPGELRTRSGRLHAFEDNAAVALVLGHLESRDPDPLVVKLPRTPGRKEAEYAHLLSGPVDVEAYVAAAGDARPSRESTGGSRSALAELTERVLQLEEEVAALKARLDADVDR